MNILLIVTGSIAAVKSYDLVRTLKHKNYSVQVVLTKSAQKFVTIDAMTSLTGQKVYTNLFDIELETTIGHIALSRNVDIILIAPATAHIIAQITHGLCDDLATTLFSAADKPIYIVPAMNPLMWQNPANQRNLTLLQQDSNIHIINPKYGLMACGEVGLGRMEDVDNIVNYIQCEDEKSKLLKGKHVLITLGATIEKIDPIRFISNFSSGKQGISLAEEAIKMGAKVTLIIAKISVDLPLSVSQHAKIIYVTSADEMLEASLVQLPVDIAICTAAVCDWKPQYHPQKIKKQADIAELDLKFIKNPDILYQISKHDLRPNYVIGFAAETTNYIENATQKLIKKGCDVIYVNEISTEFSVFGSDYNKVVEIRKNTQEILEKCSKNMVAEWILKRIPDTVLQDKS